MRNKHIKKQYHAFKKERPHRKGRATQVRASLPLIGVRKYRIKQMKIADTS